ncbi:MAG: SLC13 family permease, partial [Elusimicrobia bacterium]|nr:SLC13 family permease [Elusimicrobiota bacterium]
GNFPNILFASRAGMGFTPFIPNMLPICLLLLVVTLIYLRVTQDRLWTTSRQPRPAAGRRYGALFAPAPRTRPAPPDLPPQRAALLGSIARNPDGRGDEHGRGLKDPRTVRRGLIILAAVAAGFPAGGWLGLPPAWIAAAGGLAALFCAGPEPGRLLRELDWRDVLFFSALFILVGAARACGLLDGLGAAILGLSGGSALLRCLLLMWAAAAATAFLNAGPCTALFVPLAAAFPAASPHDLCWWSLSLGVLAGSSATLTGATAGSAAATLLAARPAAAAKAQRLTFLGYARTAAPLALIFLAVSSAYVAWLFQRG